MGLPQLDFRVPEATWFKSALAGKLGGLPGLNSTGALAWPYKIAVVAVMALVACGTLVTFGSARAETPSSSEVSALPGSDEASPSVEGQVLPPATALLNSGDLLSTLNLTDYSPDDTTHLSLSDDSDNSDDSDDEKTKTAIKKRLAGTTPTPTPTKSTTKPTPTPTKTTAAPTPTPTPKPTTPSPKPTTPSPKPEPEKHSCTLEEVLNGEGQLGSMCS